MRYLKQSTAAYLMLGPFLDDTDGKTAETGLSVAQADVRLSKNGDAYAQKNDANSNTHNENGYYRVPVNTTDTNTLGSLKVAILKSGALPVWEEYMVVPANVFDSMFGTSILNVALVDPARVWHVSKAGNDSNGGHSYADAKLTIGVIGASGALQNAVDGDTIIIWPGNYAENVVIDTKVIRVIGMSRAYTKITPASGNALLLGPKCTIRDLSVIAPSGGIGLILNGAEIVVDNCYAYGSGSDAISVYGNGTKLALLNSLFSSYGHCVQGGSGATDPHCFYAKNCIFESIGNYAGSCFALVYPMEGIYEECHFRLINTATGTGIMAAVSSSYGATNRVMSTIFKNCKFKVTTAAGYTGLVLGIYTNNADSVVVLDGCKFETSGAGATGGPRDIYNAAGKVIASNCAYSASYGTITLGGTGWTEVIDTITDILNLCEADLVIDKNTTPWNLVVKNRATQAELLRKELKDVNGSNIVSVATVIGSQTDA